MRAHSLLSFEQEPLRAPLGLLAGYAALCLVAGPAYASLDSDTAPALPALALAVSWLLAPGLCMKAAFFACQRGRQAVRASLLVPLVALVATSLSTTQGTDHNAAPWLAALGVSGYCLDVSLLRTQLACTAIFYAAGLGLGLLAKAALARRARPSSR